ncbi:leucine-rich repeat protein kinase family protein [Striga asiatica]|uniref:Leucine-rich repeat protein kinase family protein n=1 Tax=Striga asiatica TaxID=4170 RepID=A0A5A7Q373_STRAF|nr:leucine-rich repeat protein kinase family protein [Striga asiatica]
MLNSNHNELKEIFKFNKSNLSSGAFTLNRLKSDSHKFAPVAAEELLPARRSGCATGLVHGEGRARGVAAGHRLRKARGGEFASEVAGRCANRARRKRRAAAMARGWWWRRLRLAMRRILREEIEGSKE